MLYHANFSRDHRADALFNRRLVDPIFVSQRENRHMVCIVIELHTEDLLIREGSR